MTTTDQVELPDKMSELILVALQDLEKAEASPHYEVDMDFWHQPDRGRDDVCMVCLAGGVMAFSMGMDRSKSLCPRSFAKNEGKIRALDALRSGDPVWAGMELGMSDDKADEMVRFVSDVVEYRKNPDLFKRQMRNLAGQLGEAGY